jgi:hypothetical protein
MIYSEYNEGMIHKGFTYGHKHYTWCEADEMYWRDDVEGDGYDIYQAESLSNRCMIDWD